MSEALQGTQSAAKTIARVSYTHDAMIDLIIANPAFGPTDLAKHFGYTPAWVSRVMNSDAFLARLALRKAELVDPAIVASVEEKLKAAAAKSLDVVLEKLHAMPTLDQALEAVKVTTKALGYGARQTNQVAVQNNYVVALPPISPSAEEWQTTMRPPVAEIVAQ